MDNRPRGRETNITGQGKDIYKRGSGLNTGPVGGSSRPSRPTGQSGSSFRPRPSSGGSDGSSQRSTARAGGGKGLIGIILAIVVALAGGGGLLGLFGGGDSGDTAVPTTPSQSYQDSYTSSSSSSSSSGGLSGMLSSLLGGYGNTSSGWSGGDNTGTLDTSVASTARAKRVTPIGNGQDKITIMVYMCGTDLESKSGMASADLQEMTRATLSDKINLIVMTGGCKNWKISEISNTVNQIYRVRNGPLERLSADAGKGAMTNASTLTDFIKYCAGNFKADRYELIFWDHGGGSLSGYGYDERVANSGSMTLKGINTALANAGVTFDFIGFDCCLMATLENALMLSNYADYMIASEETEPGVGWYYTDWLTKLSQNTSMSTLEIGKNIVDDFVRVCNEKCAGQKTTLSVVDLAELESTVPSKLTAFASGTSQLLASDGYDTVSSARSGAREFAVSSKIDQVDLVDLANNMGTAEGKALAQALLGAVKYNRTSSSITNAYGISIYFPYQKTGKVSGAVATYNAIGMDSEYSRCIQQFANMGAAGQAVSSSSSSYASSPLSALMGSASGSSGAGSDLISSILSGLMTTGLTGRELDVDSAASFIEGHQFDTTKLSWKTVSGQKVLTLTEDDWRMVNDLELNVFYDDGEGYLDLGLDNVFDFTDEGYLKGSFNGTWLAIDEQPVAYYHTSTVDDGVNYSIQGYVPCLINGQLSHLLLTFDNENPYGVITGAEIVYDESVTETVGKSDISLTDGDEIFFVCDYYSYSGEYQNTYRIGEKWTYHADALISNVYIDASRANACYMFTDIYGQRYWSDPF